ncbi:MAG TPA: metallophosphoesterase, partial [Chitinophagaceae bacterium]|nr:metallophosphoesterase [Chitinophagaceae bacterium]
MIKTNAILFATLFAFCIGQNAEEKNYVRKQAPDPAIVDGPYVLYVNDSVFVKYIEDNSGAKTVKTDGTPATMKNNITLQVNTDVPGKTFTVQLKQKLSEEKSEYKGIKKMLVMSDIEGNFGAFRKLLQGNGVIDENFNWTYGKDHLVLVGDFVDRGTMVTEVLWLIYSLEEKAKAAGGYVHYILGNHEIMNMSDELDYVQERYIQHAQLMNKPYMQLFGQNSEIGRWLATKNVIE